MYEKHCDKEQRTVKSFDEIYRKSLQDDLNDKNEYDSLCSVFTQYFGWSKNESFLHIE